MAPDCKKNPKTTQYEKLAVLIYDKLIKTVTSLSKLVQHNEKHQEGKNRTFLICPETLKHGTAIVKA